MPTATGNGAKPPSAAPRYRNSRAGNTSRKTGSVVFSIQSGESGQYVFPQLFHGAEALLFGAQVFPFIGLQVGGFQLGEQKALPVFLLVLPTLLFL